MLRRVALALACLCLLWSAGAAGAGAAPVEVAWDGTGALHAAYRADDAGGPAIRATFDGAPSVRVWFGRTPDWVADPSIAADPGGTVWLSWATHFVRNLKNFPSQDVHTGVWVARRPPGGAPEVRRLAGAGSGVPLLRVSPAGRVVVAWTAGRDRVAVATGGGAGVGAVQTLELPAFGLTDGGIDDAGRVILAGTGPDLSIDVVELAPDGRVAGRSTVAAAGDRPLGDPALAVDGAGDLVVAWRRFDPKAIVAAVRPTGGTFSAPAEVARGAGDLGRPVATMARDGAAMMLAWWAYDPLPSYGGDIQVATAPVGAAPWTLERIPGTGSHPGSVALSPGRDGAAAVSWTSRGAGPAPASRAFVSRRPPGGSFGAPERLPSPGAAGSSAASVATGPDGRVAAGWSETGPGHALRMQLGALAGSARTIRTLLARPVPYYEPELRAGARFPEPGGRLRGRRLRASLYCYGPRLRSRCRGTVAVRVRGVPRPGRRRFDIGPGIARVHIPLPRGARASARRRGGTRARVIVRYRPAGRQSQRIRLRG